MKFMLQHSIFIVYISCRGTRGHVPAGRVEGPLFSQVLGDSVALEPPGMFSELVLAREERAVRGRCLPLNSDTQDGAGGETRGSPQSCKVVCGRKIRVRRAVEVFGSVALCP